MCGAVRRSRLGLLSSAAQDVDGDLLGATLPRRQLLPPRPGLMHLIDGGSVELVPTELAQRVSKALTIPTIGIGAGPHCDGQVLVLHDMLGLNEGFSPRFLRRFAELGAAVREAVRTYADDVRAGRYPAKEHSFE